MIKSSQPWKPKPRRHSKLYPRLNTAVPTICFVLIFLVFLQALAAGSAAHHGRQVDLPAAVTGTSELGATQNSALQLMVTRNGDCFFGRTKVAISDLPDAIRSELLPGVERRIYVKADAHAKYADVETALDAIRYAGISNITIMVEPRRDLSP
jgi:biopolymer transport protein ExbD